MNIQFEAEFMEELFFGIYGVQDVNFANVIVPCREEIQALAQVHGRVRTAIRRIFL